MGVGSRLLLALRKISALAETPVLPVIPPVTMTFGLPGSLANAGHTYSVLCLNPDGTPAIFEDIDANNATIMINATAFGTYAIMINQ